MGLGGTILQQLQYFLEAQVPKVVLGDSCSMAWPLICEVPLGSVLCPMLVNIVSETIESLARSGHGGTCHNYIPFWITVMLSMGCFLRKRKF